MTRGSGRPREIKPAIVVNLREDMQLKFLAFFFFFFNDVSVSVLRGSVLENQPLKAHVPLAGRLRQSPQREGGRPHAFCSVNTPG